MLFFDELDYGFSYFVQCYLNAFSFLRQKCSKYSARDFLKNSVLRDRVKSPAHTSSVLALDTNHMEMVSQ